METDASLIIIILIFILLPLQRKAAGVAVPHLCSPLPLPPPARPLVVPVGHNVSLSCNVTSGSAVSWFLLRSDRLLPLLTVTWSKLGGTAVNHQHADPRRVSSRGGLDPDVHPDLDPDLDLDSDLHLELQRVQEPDAGLYFCSGRCEDAVCVSGETRLVVDGGGGEAAWRPCWGLGICVLPALLVLFLVFIVGLYLCSGKPAVCCQRLTEEEALHYSSLRHAHKPRPPGRGAPVMVEDDVTYSAVMRRERPDASRDRR
ncbi:uncharacterized protein [Clinocottus analis]|uniref:uncharacterized protein n=1 Tax=Clinocottus analis TaxID=304258 RepID=UPI0035BFB7AC